MTQRQDYNPDFWLFDTVPVDSMSRWKALGFMGVGFWAADRDAHYFDSPA